MCAVQYLRDLSSAIQAPLLGQHAGKGPPARCCTFSCAWSSCNCSSVHRSFMVALPVPLARAGSMWPGLSVVIDLEGWAALHPRTLTL